MEKTLNFLYNFAENNNIDIYSFDTEQIKGQAFCFNNEYYVALNPMLLDTEAEESAILAHELGHCALRAFYTRLMPLMDRSKCERKAEIWAFKTLLPKETVLEAITNGHTETWQLAEYFNLPEPFIVRALQYYGIISY